MRVLVAGATGYVGSRLVDRLLEAGHDVTALARNPDKLRRQPWRDDVEVHVGDLLKPDTLDGMSQGVDRAAYLVHSMGGGSGFGERDRRAAANFADHAGDLDHVVYLGGLLPDEGEASSHLASRADVGALLRDRLPATEVRAGPLLGSGSGSFEMLRYLVERLPAMIAPRWVRNPVHPVGAPDALGYLEACLEDPPGGVLEVGAADRPTFRSMMGTYADVRGLRRVILPVPVLTPTLSSYWVGLVTPIPNTLATPLIQGITDPLEADLSRARDRFPGIEPSPTREAIAAALADRPSPDANVEAGLAARGHFDECRDWRGTYRDVRGRDVDAEPEAVYEALRALGGSRGWPAWSWARRLRAGLDRLLGGPGAGREPPDRSGLEPGDTLGMWEVEAADPPRHLRLRGAFRLPGRAWLGWRVSARETGSRVVQYAAYEPEGLPGAAYWALLGPIHRRVFRDLVAAVVDDAEAAPTEVPHQDGPSHS